MRVRNNKNKTHHRWDNDVCIKCNCIRTNKKAILSMVGKYNYTYITADKQTLIRVPECKH